MSDTTPHEVWYASFGHEWYVVKRTLPSDDGKLTLVRVAGPFKTEPAAQAEADRRNAQ
jgi:hypothetical protein